jgi:hypothetical protein
MKSFTDTEGRKWVLKLDWDLHEQVRQREDVNLLSIADDDFKLLAHLYSEMRVLVNVVYVLIEDQLEKNGIVGDEAMPATRKFAKGLGGDVLEKAAEALVGAVIDFFPNQAQRKMLEEVFEKGKQTGEFLTKSMQKTIRAVDPESVAKSYIDSVGNLPRLLESTPGNTHSGN